MAYTQEKWKQSIDTAPEEAQTLGLLDKEFKSALTSMFQKIKEIMYKD